MNLMSYIAGALLIACVALGGLVRCESLKVDAAVAQRDKIASEFEAHVSDDESAAEVRTADNERKESNYAKQLQDANERAEKAERDLLAMRNRPVRRLVCEQADPPAAAAGAGVPSVPGATADESAADGELPRGSGPRFDPSTAVRSLASRAESVLKECRRLYDSWPVGDAR